MPRHSLVRGQVQLALCTALLTFSISSHALTISSGPVFTPASNAPLAGVLELTTDVNSRVSVSASDGTETWERNFYEYGTVHSMPLLGFKSDRVYEITVTVRDIWGNKIFTQPPLLFNTPPLPEDFPTLTLLEHKPEKMEPGFTLLRPLNLGGRATYVVMIDSDAEVVWYSSVPSNFGVRQLANGNLLYPLPTMFVEVNLLGETVRTWPVPSGITYHHEAFPTEHGTMLYLAEGITRTVGNFPISATDPEAARQTVNIRLNPALEMSMATGQTINEWVPSDLLDPTRLTYLSVTRNGQGYDWAHANAVIEDTRDDSIIVSMRHQNAVIKFSRDGVLKWILGPHENWGPEFQQYLLTPVGAPFEWNYGQHAPMLTPQGTLLLFDNGNVRATPFDPPVPDASNYSRAVEYKINEDTLEVSQVWEYGRDIDQPLFSGSLGDADWLPTSGNVLITFGNITYVGGARPSPTASGARMARVVEVTHDQTPEVVFDLAVFDYGNTSSSYRGHANYRSDRVADLYPVFSPASSLEVLLAEVDLSDVHHDQSLIASLKAALKSINLGHSLPAIHQLRAFQIKVLIQVACSDPELAKRFVYEAQGIIDAITDGESSMCGQRHGFPKPKQYHLKLGHRNGRPCIEFRGDRDKHYFIEASSDMVHWVRIGTARHKGSGEFDFEDGEAMGVPTRYYRLREDADASGHD